MNTPVISVVMPVYNGEKYLKEAIDSIFNQTFQDFEFIIIDDGSHDGSLEIIKSYQKKDNRVVIISRANKGTIETLNEGISHARGKYIARMDQDDISLPERFAKQVELLEKIDADICGCQWLIMNEAGKSIDCFTVPLTPEAFIMYLSYSVPFAHGSVLIRKSFLEKNNIYYDDKSSKYAEDYVLWIKMYENNAKFINVDDFLFKYRQSQHSFSQTNFKRNRADAKNLSISFMKNHINECEVAFESLIKQQLSRKEQELLMIFGLRLSIITKKIHYCLSAINKIDKNYLPNNLLKSLYSMLCH